MYSVKLQGSYSLHFIDEDTGGSPSQVSAHHCCHESQMPGTQVGREVNSADSALQAMRQQWDFGPDVTWMLEFRAQISRNSSFVL